MGTALDRPDKWDTGEPGGPQPCHSGSWPARAGSVGRSQAAQEGTPGSSQPQLQLQGDPWTGKGGVSETWICLLQLYYFFWGAIKEN